jgi:hypothetical protein
MLAKRYFGGRNALQRLGSVSMRGEPIRSRQYGIAGNTACMLVRIEAGRPGKLTIRLDARMPAVWRDRIAVGTCFKLSERISSPNPGISRVHAATVASGVRSRDAGPVPPVVKINAHRSRSARSIKASRTVSTPSGTRRRTARQGVVTTSCKNSSMAGPLISRYAPALARSDTVTIPIGTASLSSMAAVPEISWLAIIRFAAPHAAPGRNLGTTRGPSRNPVGDRSQDRREIVPMPPCRAA